MGVIALRCVGTMACLDAVQDALAKLFADACDADGVDRMLFETALVEIVGNLIEHARTAADDPVTIDVHVAVHPDRIEAVMLDNGTAPRVDPIAPGEPVEDMAEGGRGLALARAVAEVTHVYQAGGNRWTVTRRRTG